MRAAAWYEANSYCCGTTQRHEATPVTTLLGEVVGHLCIHCLGAIRPVRRGSDLWISEELAA